ncbi:MAG TPA: hypothetical protein VJ891_02955 [Casimicrobiaceae bacterium]|nr:hypothetical protein [Casimicrobiaceae bacterium]
MRAVNLRAVATADFRSSEFTNFEAWKKKHGGLAKKLGETDAVLFLSQSGGQIVFVHGFTTFETRNRRAGTGEVLRSERLRLRDGTWSPYLIADYAACVGLKLNGLKRFVDYVRRLGHHAPTADAA